MKIKYYFLTGLCTVSLLGLSSCFDDNFDLSDIDTTAKIEMNELTIPLKLNKVNLDKVLDIKEGSQIKQDVFGNYAVIEEGSFVSNKINIPTFSANPDIPSISANLSLNVINDLNAKVEDIVKKYTAELEKNGFDAEAIKSMVEAKREEKKAELWSEISDDEIFANYSITEKETSLSSSTNNVDKSVRSIDNIGVSSSFKLSIAIDNNLASVIDNVKIEGLKIQMPKGLEIKNLSQGKYDSAAGILDLSDEDVVVKNGVYDGLSFDIVKINNSDDMKFTPGNNGAGTFTFSSTIKASGSVAVKKSNFKSDKTFFDLPSAATYSCKPEMGNIEVKTFSGKIKYEIDEVNARSIDINDIPEVLNGDEVNVVLSNPQLYVNISNPLSGENLQAEATLSLIPEKNGVLRNPIEHQLTASSSDNLFCISPSKPNSYYEGFAESKHETFTDLKNIVSGNGLPDKINVKVKNPCVPEQTVTDFELGRTFDGVEGKYTFYAPLALDANTTIIYKDVMNGWNDDTLDKITIKKLIINATVDTNIPIGAEITVKPIDPKGNVIEGVSFTTAKIEANKNGQVFVVEQTAGTIQHLDGISFRASINATGSETAISKLQYIQLNNVKVTVTGYYQDEL